jgi:O-antigen/teichoic acid export membrane protein
MCDAGRLRSESDVPSAPAGGGSSDDFLNTSLAGPAAVRGGALRGVGYIVGIALSLGFVPLLTRHLGVVGFGRYITVMALIATVASICDAGITTVGVREFTVRSDPARRGLVANLLGLRTVVSSAGALCALAFAAGAGYPDVMIAGTVVAGVAMLLSDIQETLAIPLAATLKLGRLSVLALTRQATLAAFVVALVLAGSGLLPFFAASVAAEVVAIGLTIRLMGPGTSLVPAFDLSEWRSILKDLLPYSAATSITAFRVVIVLMPLLAVALEAGYFSLPFRIIEVLAALGFTVVVSAFPILARAARDDHSRLAYALQRLFEVGTLAAVGLALLLIVGAKVAVDLLGGPKYAPSVPVLQILAATLIASYLEMIAGLALLSLRRHAAVLVTNLGTVVVAIVLTAVLVPPYGAKGAAVALLVAEFAHLALYVLALLRGDSHLRVSLSILPKVVLAVVPACVVTLLLPIPRSAAMTMALAIYLAILLAARAIPTEVWDALRSRRGEATLPR